MEIEKITIIGGGNLGTSIARGLLKLKEYSRNNIIISEKRPLRIRYLKDNDFNVAEADNAQAIYKADLVIVAVKPQQINEVIDEIKPAFKPEKQVMVSTVTGFSLAEIEERMGRVPVVRIMPNTAIEIRESITCMTARNIETTRMEAVVDLFNRLGKTVVIQEELMGAATVLGACGVAFALRFLRAATQGGIEIGFSAEMSQLIASQTVKGAAQLILENNSHPETEIDKVTTPQGITISGLNEMEHQGFSSALIKGLITSFNKLEKFLSNSN